jgi:hypothetical protein
MVRKTVQVKQYEPTMIEFSMESTCPRDQVVMEFGKAFAEIKGELNRIFGGPKDPDCLS